MTTIGDEAFAGCDGSDRAGHPGFGRDARAGVVGNSLELVEYGYQGDARSAWKAAGCRCLVASLCAAAWTAPSSTTAARRTDAAKARYFGEGMTSRVLRRGRAARPGPALHAHPPRPRAGAERREEGRTRRCTSPRAEGSPAWNVAKDGPRGGGHRRCRTCTPTRLPSDDPVRGMGIAEAGASVHATRARPARTVDVTG